MSSSSSFPGINIFNYLKGFLVCKHAFDQESQENLSISQEKIAAAITIQRFCRGYLARKRTIRNLKFDTPVIISLEASVRLGVRISDGTSIWRRYSDSFFEFENFLDKNGNCVTKVIRRKKILPLPLNPSIINEKQKQLPSDRELMVKCAEKKDYQKIADIAETYQHKAREVKSDLSFDCYTIWKLVKQCLRLPVETNYIWNKAFVCEDVALKHIQAIALIEYNIKFPHYFGCTIAHIVTNPENLKMESLTKVKGAGTKLINYIIEFAKKKNIESLSCESVETAVVFYQKCGFKIMKDRPTMEPGTIPMQKELNL